MIRLSHPLITDDEINEITKVLKSGMLVQGARVAQFEESLKNYMKANYVLAVSSGTAALHLALATLDIKEGDAVFIPAFTFPATANVVEIQRARPVLVDVEIDSYNINPDKLEEAIKNWKGPQVPKAIIVVHEFGAPCNMEKIMGIAKKFNLFVIEDAACALGATFDGQHVGTFGDIGCFSWHPRKAITTGEGGALVIKEKKLYDKLKLLRNHGLHRDENGTTDFLLPGFNYRLTEFQAVLGDMQLKKFKQWLIKRKELTAIYLEELIKSPQISLPKDINGHAWQTFMVILPESINRKHIIDNLLQQNIETNLGAQAIHMLSYYKEKYHYSDMEYPIAKKLYQQGLALPLHPSLIKGHIYFICSTFKKSLTESNV